MLSNSLSKRFLERRPGYSILPIDLVIVRNGTSEGSIALQKYQKGGANEMFVSDLMSMHSSKWRLTEFGRIQARATGKWIMETFDHPFDAYMTGEYVRSLETAACLNLPEAQWIPSLYLRPRDFGSFSQFDREFNKKEQEQHMKERARDAFYWTPPNGESIAHLTLRTERVIHWIRNHVPCTGSAIIVTHRDVMETMRIRLERVAQMDYSSKIANPPNHLKLNYCSVLQYTRRNPKTGEVVPRYQWFRVVTPWMGKNYIPSNFEEIITRHYGNTELLAEISNVPRLF